MEFKLLDWATNHASRTEMIKQILSENNNIRIKYYSGFKIERNYYGLSRDVINYINSPSIPKLRFIFISLGILIQIIKSIFFIKPNVIILDYSANLVSFPFLILNKWINEKTKIILDVRTIPVGIKTFWISKILFSLSLFIAKFTCDGITFISSFMRDYCLKYINLKNKKNTIWSSGFNKIIFDPEKYKRNRSSNNFEILYHGSVTLSRGVGSLIEAIGILRNKNYPVSLRLVGNIIDEKEIKSIILKNGLKDLCKIYPPVAYEEIPQIIKNCDLPVIPHPRFIGWRVSSPLKLMEYMAMGKSVVLTDIEAHRDIVDKYKFAFFIKSSKPEDIAEGIEKAYLKRSEFNEFGKKAREIALNKYTWHHQARKLLNFIKSI